MAEMLSGDEIKVRLQLLRQHGWPMKAERWTTEQLDTLQKQLNQNYLLNPLFSIACDAIGSLRFDLVDANVPDR